MKSLLVIYMEKHTNRVYVKPKRMEFQRQDQQLLSIKMLSVSRWDIVSFSVDCTYTANQIQLLGGLGLLYITVITW